MTTQGLIAKKIGMTRMVDQNGQMIAVTLLQVASQKVTKLLGDERDGYHGFQIGFAEKAEKNLTKPDVHRLRKVGIQENFSQFKEVRLEKPAEGIEVGSTFGAALLEGVAAVDVTGLTKGRGFSGSIKRWNTACGRMSHGSRFHRRPGSLGTRTTPGRVFKGKPQTGQYGHERVTIQNLRVVDVDTTNNTIALSGAVPGHRNGFLMVSPSVKLK